MCLQHSDLSDYTATHANDDLSQSDTALSVLLEDGNWLRQRIRRHRQNDPDQMGSTHTGKRDKSRERRVSFPDEVEQLIKTITSVVVDAPV